MTICLTKSEVSLYSAEIKEEFERVLRSPQMKRRHGAKQWAFFRHCLEVLLGETLGDYECNKMRANDYWDEISKKLKKYYLRAHDHHLPGQGFHPVRFKFWLKDEKHRNSIFGRDTEYPCSNGYLFLIIPTDPELKTRQQMRAVLSRVIDDAINAAFDVFRALPEEKPSVLEKHFAPDGSAYEEVLETVRRHKEQREIISNRENPSTRPQLRYVELKSLGENFAKVKTVEYWNLHWLSTVHKVYVKIYEGQNKQHYELVRRGERWLVKENRYRDPRGSAP